MNQEHKDKIKVYNEVVAVLFDDHLDLLDEFTIFLPKAASLLAHNVPYLRNSFQYFNERSSGMPTYMWKCLVLESLHLEWIHFKNLTLNALSNSREKGE
ncbi:hypothetical protein RGQ29_012412 [Quercus rubra]|uniref:Uncharacterized protein n=1 Tax=Quercus rubra TaxID=3512 RepID=A0AAN7G137_QUERU|nr:hypothetical protein RGQ29_012412 [Quercus rubra]